MFTFFKKLASALSQKISSIFSNGYNEKAFDRLEQLFYEADLGAATSAELVDKIRTLSRKSPSLTTDQILSFVKEELLKLFPPAKPAQRASPHIILIVGVNGSGKTTSIAKLASHYRTSGKKVLIAAGDTFRAAAVEQLEIWAKRSSIDIVKS
ncbi:MAG TPA: signal recognition particle receptor subunit alpha, partial [Chlamydiales bacterium]|nr:signal recognition particle receptor subunit alpha [Chlamydiales bacterium]